MGNGTFSSMIDYTPANQNRHGAYRVFDYNTGTKLADRSFENDYSRSGSVNINDNYCWTTSSDTSSKIIWMNKNGGNVNSTNTYSTFMHGFVNLL